MARQRAAHADTREIDFVSPALSRFWGRPIRMRGWVVTPPGYAAHPGEHYPTVYFTHGFGGRLRTLVGTAVTVHSDMATGAMPPMIWVLLDESGPAGTHEFADSVNNGPWGEALTTELIPSLERTWRMDARPSGRFLVGHSSGGWAALWLQVRYPAIFGGSWPTSPDPSDFHDFTGPDLYAPDANIYRKPDGSPWPIMRDHGKVEANMEDFARIEAVEGDVGGQMASFDWVFSPRGADGRPQPMFDRVTGAVDPDVVAYWRDHYDIAHRIAANWPALKADLDGKIHLTVGTADTFYLDGAAHRLKAVLDGLGARSDFRFLPDRTHFDLYQVGDDPRGLLKEIAWEMYAVARPRAPRPAVQGQPAPAEPR
jgi:S-formylglutathione hydrolase FrmB